MFLDEIIIKGIKLKPESIPQIIQYTNVYAEKFAVNTPIRLAHFLAQVCHESNGFFLNEESLNYKTPERLMIVWPKRFTTIEFANNYINNAEKLANYVYANRNGNGNAETGDGYRFRGRGPMQTTGKENYAKYSAKIFNNDTLLTKPELLADLQYGLQTAFIEWNEKACNDCADKDSINDITKKINGGSTNLNSRIAWLQIWKEKFKIV